MYHIDNLGDFGRRLLKYSDLDGYIPEAGDEHDAGNWPADPPFIPNAPHDPDGWDEFRAAAVEETLHAMHDLREWRAAQEPHFAPPSLTDSDREGCEGWIESRVWFAKFLAMMADRGWFPVMVHADGEILHSQTGTDLQQPFEEAGAVEWVCLNFSLDGGGVTTPPPTGWLEVIWNNGAADETISNWSDTRPFNLAVDAVLDLMETP